MFLSMILSAIARSNRFTWSPSLDLTDHSIRSTLIPGVQY